MNITLKPATLSDITFLWYLRNQPDVYEYFKTPKPVLWEQHVQWMMPVLLSLVPRKLYVISYGKMPAGQLRFDYEGNKAEISVSLLKELRGKGIAKEALMQGIKSMKKEKTIKTLVAQIHKENVASSSLFEKLQFRYYKKQGSYFIYHLAL